MTLAASPKVTSRRLNLWSETAGACLLVAETIVFTIVNRLFFINALHWTFLAGLVALTLCGSYLLMRAMHRFQILLAYRRIIFLVWGTILLYAIFKWLLYPTASANPFILFLMPFAGFFSVTEYRYELIQALVFMLILWRGVSLANEATAFLRSIHSFQLGAFLFILYGFSLAWTSSFSTVIPFLLFVFFSLIGITFARMGDITTLRGGRIPVLNRGWVLGILLTALAVILLSSLAGFFASTYLSGIASKIVLFAFTVLGVVVLIIAAPVIILFLLMLPWLNEQVKRFVQNAVQTGSLEIYRSITELQNIQPEGAVRSLNFAITIALALVMTGLIVFVLIRLRASRKRIASQAEDDAESLEKTLKKLRRGGAVFSPIHPLARLQQMMAAARIRQIYIQLLALCARLNLPRPHAATPREFLLSMNELFPRFQTELGLITDAYQRIRYGQLPEQEAEVSVVIEAWRAIREYGRKEIRERKRRMRY